MPSIKYFGLAQLCGSFIDSVKEKCSPCFPIEWCGVGINATTDGIRDGRYESWLHRESPHPLDRYEQKVPPIKFHEKDVEEIIGESKHVDDMGLNPYCTLPSTSTRARMYRMRFGVKRGLKKVSSKLRVRPGKKKHCFGTEKVPDSATISTYPTQELVMAETGFLYPVQEETDADDSVV